MRPQDIRSTALLTIEGELDDISGRGQTHAAHDQCRGLSSRDKRFVNIPGCRLREPGSFYLPVMCEQVFAAIMGAMNP
ncbi:MULTISPECIES: hypothetical protein [Cupriavidus]|uniref:hypothetical protein n=1 Tax=Cupriavidus oxalaticus TaxID=96344 RepID=UPI0027962F07|nr:hypothetical protein [Cupriavidus taiwanensis]